LARDWWRACRSLEDKIAKGVRAVRVPAISVTKESDLVISYGPDLRESIRRTARYVDKILKGARPAELPIEQVSEYKLVVNLAIARAMGLQVPETLLLRADEVIR
jgi:putative ABC transport system substrate-binding protein